MCIQRTSELWGRCAYAHGCSEPPNTTTSLAHSRTCCRRHRPQPLRATERWCAFAMRWPAEGRRMLYCFLWTPHHKVSERSTSLVPHASVQSHSRRGAGALDLESAVRPLKYARDRALRALLPLAVQPLVPQVGDDQPESFVFPVPRPRAPNPAIGLQMALPCAGHDAPPYVCAWRRIPLGVRMGDRRRRWQPRRNRRRLRLRIVLGPASRARSGR